MNKILEKTIKEVTELFTTVSSHASNEKIIKNMAVAINSGYSNEHGAMSGEDIVYILTYKSNDDPDYQKHLKRLARLTYSVAEPEACKNISYDNISTKEKNKYETIVMLLATNINDASLINKIKRVGNDFIMVNQKIANKKYG